MKTGYFLIADILGFSNIIKNVHDDQLEERMKNWTDLTGSLIKKYEVGNHQLLSDTLFIGVEGDSPKALKILISFCQELLTEGLKKSLPVKGGIVFGNYTWGDFIYGKAVIEGHKIEIVQNWIGITLHNKIPHLEKFWGTDKIICYPTPMKSGQVEIYPVIAWMPPKLKELTELTTKGGLGKEGDVLEWSWAEKIRNTLEFGLYLSVLKQSGETGEKFYGLLPIEVIGGYIDEYLSIKFRR